MSVISFDTIDAYWTYSPVMYDAYPSISIIRVYCPQNMSMANSECIASGLTEVLAVVEHNVVRESQV